MKKILSLSLLIAFALTLIHCKTAKDVEEEIIDEVMSTTVDSTLNTTSEALSDANKSGSGISRIAFFDITEKKSSLHEFVDFFKSIKLTSPIASAYASATNVACPGGGTYDYTGDNWGGATTFTVTRTFNNCYGQNGYTKANGTTLIKWTNLSTTTPFIQATTTMERAPFLTMSRPLSTINVSGNGTALDATHKVSHTINWTSVSGSDRAFSVAIDVTRTHTNSRGVTRTVTVKTTTPLSFTVVGGVRTLVSGTKAITISSPKSSFTVNITYTNVVWNDNFLPTGGSIAMSIAGTKIGTGNITFTGTGSATYSTSVGGSTYTGTVTVDGN